MENLPPILQYTYPTDLCIIREGDIVNASVRPSVRQTVGQCPSRFLLLNHWAELSQTCYITSLHGKGVREQHYFSVHSSVRASVVRPCVRHAILLDYWVECNQTGYIAFSHVKSVREQHFFVRLSFLASPSSIHLPVTLSPPKPTDGIQPNLLHHFPLL